MTLEDAGKICTLQARKIAEVDKNQNRLTEKLNEHPNYDYERIGYDRQFIKIDRDVIQSIFEQLEDYKKHLEEVLRQEIILK